MAGKNDNLKPFKKGTISSEVAKANGSKGGKAKAAKKTVAEYLKKWADSEVDEKNKKALQALTNRIKEFQKKGETK